MTARNLQEEVKKKGLPWAAVKGFDTFTPIGYADRFDLLRLVLMKHMRRSYVPKSGVADPHNLNIWLKVCHALRLSDAKTADHNPTQINEQIKQNGTTSDMIFRIPRLIQHVSSIMTLEEGDLVLTGTPAGVGPLVAGDKVECGLVNGTTNEELQRITFGVRDRIAGYLYVPPN